ncbi:UDP-glycosyltransferase 83A1 [Apostasia shenzhenica]|uniref:UDP-glycosyltransferase 83A1 n=1 Tax=Apostasia shenzhenica TaxID=1088818 RepID=A0A2I0AK43_9ASPA|nr:UDP-glycosyltransferase 83A1 [Apostasia shenzhenica]
MAHHHALVIPYPAQGHVIPLMELSFFLLRKGFKVSFLNTEFNHHRILSAMADEAKNRVQLTEEEEPESAEEIRLIAMPDGLAPGEDRNDLGRLTEALAAVMPEYLEDLLRNGDFTCVVADLNMAWSLEMAKKAGLRTAAFWPAAATLLAAMTCIPKLIEDEVIGEDGRLKRKGRIEIRPGMYPIDTAHLCWNCFADAFTRRTIFNLAVDSFRSAKSFTEIIVSNSSGELEKPVFAFAPFISPIGPLLRSEGKKRLGHFWPQDNSCFSWLDRQPPNSVVYVAFGSFAVFNSCQYRELALGLELAGLPFLWAVRSDSSSGGISYPAGFLERIGDRGRTVEWAPQQRVLGHPAIACFVSHCGWNSTMEGVRNGVPFLCWPYFADQFINERYICDDWKIGMKLVADDNGIISREEISSKVKKLVGDEKITANSVELMEKVERSIGKGGSSYENLSKFVEAMKRV